MLNENVLFQVFAYGQVFKKAVMIPGIWAVYTLGRIGELLPRFEIEISNGKENEMLCLSQGIWRIIIYPKIPTW